MVALASVKRAASEANQKLGQFDTEIAEAIIAACADIRDGSLHDQFVVDQIQGGAGTSTNTNANEQLNAFEPIIARALLSSLGHLTAAVAVLGQRCIKGITANPERMRDAVLQSASIATALNPVLGYEAATALVAEAIATAASKPELVPRSALIDDAVLAHDSAPKTCAGLTIPKRSERSQRVTATVVARRRWHARPQRQHVRVLWNAPTAAGPTRSAGPGGRHGWPPRSPRLRRRSPGAPAAG